MSTIMRAEKIGKKFLRKSGDANFFYAVKPQSLHLEAGTVTVIAGRSGSGKTTLLSMLSGLLTPSEGKVYLNGAGGEQELYQLDDGGRSAIRSSRIGVIPQGRSVLDHLTVMENLLLPGLFETTGGTARTAEAALALMEEMRIGQLKDAAAAELSGGEVRRVSIVRALLTAPELIFADEPTGDLDDENTRIVLERLRREADRGAAIVLVSHETAAFPYADQLFRMDAGTLLPMEGA